MLPFLPRGSTKSLAPKTPNWSLQRCCSHRYILFPSLNGKSHEAFLFCPRSLKAAALNLTAVESSTPPLNSPWVMPISVITQFCLDNHFQLKCGHDSLSK